MSTRRQRDRRMRYRKLRALREGVRRFYPGYFALVMATGAISIACQLLGMRAPALVLVGVNWLIFPMLVAVNAVRIVKFRSAFVEDISDHQRAPGFFTWVAGACVLGTQNMVVLGAQQIALVLWWTGLLLWGVVMYTFFTAVTVRARKPTLAHGINGAWLTASVATQSIVVLRGVIDAGRAPPEPIQFLALSFFFIGAMLYLAIIPLIFYRLTFVTMRTSDFGPPYWINMGAVAISTLAGSLLIMRSGDWPLIEPLLPFIKGLTGLFWATATWWAPFLFALMIWRYVWERDPVRYDPSVWGMIFPLGMYTTCTLQFSRAMDYPFLAPLSGVLIYFALFAWAIAAIGLGRRLMRLAGT